MQVSTWNETNQHWVPQFLLKGFGIKRNASRVFQLDKQTGKISEHDVGDVASKRRLLSERDDELLNETEVRVAQVLGKIRKGKFDITLEQRRTLDSMVYLMVLNDPYSNIDKEAVRENSIQNVSSEIEAALTRWGASIDHQQLKEWVNGVINHDYLNIAMEREFNLVLTALSLMGLSVYVPLPGEFFVIGDSPVLLVRGTEGGETSLLHPGSQVILPIHSKSVLVYSWDVPPNAVQFGGELEKDQVHSLGADYFRNVDCRYIFGRSRAILNRARTPLEVRGSSAHSPQITEGWVMMRLEQERAAASHAAKASDFKSNLDSMVRELVTRAHQEGERADSDDF